MATLCGDKHTDEVHTFQIWLYLNSQINTKLLFSNQQLPQTFLASRAVGNTRGSLWFCLVRDSKIYIFRLMCMNAEH